MNDEIRSANNNSNPDFLQLKKTVTPSYTVDHDINDTSANLKDTLSVQLVVRLPMGQHSRTVVLTSTAPFDRHSQILKTALKSIPMLCFTSHKLGLLAANGTNLELGLRLRGGMNENPKSDPDLLKQFQSAAGKLLCWPDHSRNGVSPPWMQSSPPWQNDWARSASSSAFDRERDDAELLWAAFERIDTVGRRVVTADELRAAGRADPPLADVMEAVLASAAHARGGEEPGAMDFEEFRAAAARVPRARGARVDFAASLGLADALARHLRVGHLQDPLDGIRRMTDAELDSAAADFARVDLPRLLRAGRDSLAGPPPAGPPPAAGGPPLPDAPAVPNPKFCLDGGLGRPFAGDVVARAGGGLTTLLGAPHPNLWRGMQREHCERANARRRFVCRSYGYLTTPAEEWEFAVAPREGHPYAHTPQRRADWRVPPGHEWRGEHGRRAAPLEGFLGSGRAARCGLRMEEVAALRLLTGPMAALYAAALRGFPEDLAATLEGNRYETTLMCAASAVSKLARHAEAPAAGANSGRRRVYVGLASPVLPLRLWDEATRADGPATEAGLLLVTPHLLAAAQPLSPLRRDAAGAGESARRGAVLEVECGRWDGPADLQWIAQYPAEALHAFPPLCRLEASGPPRAVPAAGVTVFPVRVTPPAAAAAAAAAAGGGAVWTVEDLVGRRKGFLVGLLDTLEAELETEALGYQDQLLAPPGAGSPGGPETVLATAQLAAAAGEEEAPLSAGDAEAAVAALAGTVRRELAAVADRLRRAEPPSLDDDDTLRAAAAEALRARQGAGRKAAFYLRTLRARGGGEALGRVLARPAADFAGDGAGGVRMEILTGLGPPFPWRDLAERRAVVDLGGWTPTGLDPAQLSAAARALAANDRARFLRVDGSCLRLPEGWETREVKWDAQPPVQTALATVVLLLANCRSMTSLSLKHNQLQAAGWRAVLGAAERVTSLTSLNGFDQIRPLIDGEQVKLDLGGKDLPGQEMLLPLARLLPRSAATLTALDLSRNHLGPAGAATLAPALATLSALTTLDLSENGLGPEGASAAADALAALPALKTLRFHNNGLAADAESRLKARLPRVADLRLRDTSPAAGIRPPAAAAAAAGAGGAMAEREVYVEVPVERVVERVVYVASSASARGA